MFKKNYQATPMSYVLKLRLHEACTLLTGSGRAIAAIAYDVGFSDSNYFTRQFRKSFGMPPRQYRASGQKD